MRLSLGSSALVGVALLLCSIACTSAVRTGIPFGDRLLQRQVVPRNESATLVWANQQSSTIYAAMSNPLTVPPSNPKNPTRLWASYKNGNSMKLRATGPFSSVQCEDSDVKQFFQSTGQIAALEAVPTYIDFSEDSTTLDCDPSNVIDCCGKVLMDALYAKYSGQNGTTVLYNPNNQGTRPSIDYLSNIPGTYAGLTLQASDGSSSD